MKNLFIAALIILSACNSNNESKQTGFTIEGMVSGVNEGTAYLLKEEDRELVKVDSSEIKMVHSISAILLINLKCILCG